MSLSLTSVPRLSNYVRVCEAGRLRVKRTRDVSEANFRLDQRRTDKRDCTWYGEAFCHGDEVIVSISYNRKRSISFNNQGERPY